jgi:hypothetical protein
MYWADDALVMQRRAEDGSFELIMVRSIDPESNPDAPQLILKSTHRDLGSGKETEATSWFTRTGASPNPAPVPDMSAIHSNITESAAAAPAIGGGTMLDIKDEELDNEDDDDDVAVAKMRTISTAQKAAYSAKIYSGTKAPSSTFGFFGGSSKGRVSTIQSQTAKNAVSSTPVSSKPATSPTKTATASSLPASLKASLAEEFAGSWSQQGANKNNSMSLSFKIVMMPNNSCRIIEQTATGKTIEDINLVIDGPVVSSKVSTAQVALQSPPVTTPFLFLSQVQSKSFKSRLYFEGNSLVLHRANSSEKYELFIKREIEDEGRVMRMVTTRKELKTGVESESMTLFQRAK